MTREASGATFGLPRGSVFQARLRPLPVGDEGRHRNSGVCRDWRGLRISLLNLLKPPSSLIADVVRMVALGHATERLLHLMQAQPYETP